MTPEKSQLIGHLMADGYVSERKRMDGYPKSLDKFYRIRLVDYPSNRGMYNLIIQFNKPIYPVYYIKKYGSGKN